MKKRKIFFKVSTLLGLTYEELGCEEEFEILTKERKTFQHFPPPVVLNTHRGIRGNWAERLVTESSTGIEAHHTDQI